jgi:hypothetical protein
MLVARTTPPTSTPAPRNRGEALATLLATVAQRRAEFDANQQLSDDVVALLKDCGV